MSDLVVRGAAHMSVARYRLVDGFVSYAQGVVERTRREQSGQDMVEYAGVLVIVAALILAMVKFASPISKAVDGGVTSEISKIFGS